MDMDYCSYMVTDCARENDRENDSDHVNEMDVQRRYKDALAANLLCEGQSSGGRKALLSFHARENSYSHSGRVRALEDSAVPLYPLGQQHRNRLLQTSLHHSSSSSSSSVACKRHIPSSPVRILDAPELRDDYYLNLVSWGENNVLAVALDKVVYLYHTATGAIHELKACSARNEYVTSVAWATSATSPDRLAIGTSNAELQLWDAATATKVRSLRNHQERIGALAWNGQTLSSGSRDTKILHHDLRIGHQQAVVSTLVGHHQEICGLSWSPDGRTLASGGNDNCMCLWDAAKGSNGPRQKLLQHKAAVKALDWCPWERHLLASGGGTADRSIKFWNTANGKLLSSVNTGSQVCGLVWSKTEKELLSSHGFSQNELCLWRYPTMARMREFTGHTARVLHLAMSPDGASVVSAAADETLRFWNVFASAKHARSRGQLDTLLPNAIIR